MEDDPWYWTVQQVSEFFSHRALFYVDDLPNCRLPDLPPFLRSLALNDVSGAVLLTAVDPGFLRDDCGISSLGIRSTVIHCIYKLRAQSALYDGRRSVQAPLQPTSCAPNPRSLQTGGQSQDANNNLPVGEQSLRDGERQVEDVRGRKRRRLDLSKPEQVRPKTNVGARPLSSGYLGDGALPVDEFFFGKTLLGHEIGASEQASEILVLEDDRDGWEDNFQLQAQDKFCGERHYVWSQMRHFLCSESQIEIQRRGRPSVAILPYRERFVVQNKPRSAMVFKVDYESRIASASRENAALLDVEHDYSGLAQTSTSTEWDFLLAKHKGSEELPAYHGSLEEDISSSLAAELEEEEVERARESQGRLTVAQISEVMDEAILKFVDEWNQGKRLQLEEKQAWRIWKQMKRSKTMRDILIDDASAKITHLEQRLEKYKSDFRVNEWHSQRDLRATCEIMRVTVEDREELRWKEDVWARRKEPRHRRVHHGSTASRKFARHRTPGFTVRPDDRLSMSPRSDISRMVEDTSNAKEPHVPDQDISDGENGTVERDQRVPAESDEGAIFYDDELPSSPPVTDHQHSSEAQTVFDFQGEPSSSETIPEVSSLPTRRPKLHPKFTNSSPTKPPPTQGVEQEPIDLTNISSDPSSPQKRSPFNQPRLQAGYSEDPQAAERAQVEAWDIYELAEQRDRMRLLIKLLHLAGPEARDTLHSCFQDLRMSAFDTLVNTLRKMKDPEPGPGPADSSPAPMTDPKHRDALKKLAEMALVWFLGDPDVTKRPLTAPEWNNVMRSKDQFHSFVEQARTFLRKRKGKLFQSPRRPSTASVVSISDDDLNNAPAHMTPHKTRKRHVSISQTAKDARAQALQRQEKFNSAIKSQSSNSQELAAMLDTGSSKSEIIINLTRKDGEEPICVHPNIARKIKAHQVEGVRFMWREITNDGDNGEQGCILAHTMGLGKTMQTISLLTAVNEAALSPDLNVNKQLPGGLRPKGIYNERQLRMLILSPPMLLQNWRREIDEWVGLALGNIFVIESALANQKRMDELETWHRLGGVLLISYNIFQSYVQKHSKLHDPQKIERILLHDPELVVVDEVHALKNKDSKLARAASRLRTHSRIGLTGTPMSNDVQEIYALISFVAPGYLGEPNEFRARFTEPIQQGTYVNSTSYEVRTSRKKLEVLRLEIEPKVNRANITVLRGSLKPKVEFVITLPLTQSQRRIYDAVIDVFKEADRQCDTNQIAIFGWLAMLTVLTNHPIAFKRKLLLPAHTHTTQSKHSKSPGTPDYDGSTDAVASAEMHSIQTVDAAGYTGEPEEDPRHASVFSEEVIKSLTAMIPDVAAPNLSAKASMFLEILDLSQKCGDKVLAFSSSIPTLDYLGELLQTSNTPFVRIDGKVQTGRRLALVEQFNCGAASVMLVSTRAGSTGLNIQSANRVVIFDFGFNPSWEEQAIGRVYRLGQTKPVFVYRFVIGGTFEDKIYDKQLFKQGLTLRVVDKQNPRRNVTRDVRDFIYKATEIQQQQLDKWLGKDPSVLDQIVQGYGQTGSLIRALSTMETLQEDAGDMPLTEEDWKDIHEFRGAMASSRIKGRRALQTGFATGSTPVTPSTTPSAAPAPARVGVNDHAVTDAP